MFATKQTFKLEKHCPVVKHAVMLSGLQLALADGKTETVKKTCVKFSDCYKDSVGEPGTGNIVPHAGCLLGDPQI